MSNIGIKNDNTGSQDIRSGKMVLWGIPVPGMFEALWNRLGQNPLFYRLATAAFWSAVGVVSARCLGLVVIILVARLMGQENYGKLGIIDSTIEMFNAFAGFGLGLTTTKYIAEFRRTDKPRAGRIISLSTVFSLVSGSLLALSLAIFASPIAERLLSSPQLEDTLRIAAIGVVFGGLSGSQSGVLRGFEAFKELSRIQVVTGVVKVPMMIAGVLLADLNGVVVAIVADEGLTCLLKGITIRQLARKDAIHIDFSHALHERNILWKFSLPNLISSLLVMPVNWFLQVLLINHSGYADLAIYTVASKWKLYINFLPEILSSSYLPIMSSMREPSKRRRFMVSNCLLTSGVGGSIVFAIVLAAPWIMGAYGEGFLRGVLVFRVLCVTAVADAVNMILFQTILASGKAWLRLVSNSGWAITVSSLGFFLVPRWGAIGIAATFFISYAIHLSIQFPLAFRSLKN